MWHGAWGPENTQQMLVAAVLGNRRSSNGNGGEQM